MHETRFDDPGCWWFLTPAGFSKFTLNPVAQGYEILSRHPDFPHLVVNKKGHKKKRITWEHGNRHLPRPTWRELCKEARSAFLFDYKLELRRMGLLPIAWLGPKAVTFNCTDGVPSILKAVDCRVGQALLFKGLDQKCYRRRTSPDLLKFSVNYRGNLDMVTLDWGALVKSVNHSGNVVAAVRTFLEHDPNYREYRGARLAARSRHCDTLKKRITDLKKEETRLLTLKDKAKSEKKPTDKLEDELNEIRRHITAHENSLRHLLRRLEKTSPRVIALACVAWDCQQVGFTSVLTQ